MINAVVDINSVGGEEFLKQIGGPGKCQGRRREVTFQLDFDSKCVRRGGGVEGWRGGGKVFQVAGTSKADVLEV